MSLAGNVCWTYRAYLNTLRLRQNGCYFTDDIFKWLFLNKDFHVMIEITLNFIPQGPIDNKWILFQIVVWCQSGNKPLIWTNVGIGYRGICASPSLIELRLIQGRSKVSWERPIDSPWQMWGLIFVLCHKKIWHMVLVANSLHVKDRHTDKSIMLLEKIIYFTYDIFN